MASWNIPALINKISEDVPAIKALLTALFKWTDADTTDVPVGAKRLQAVTGGRQMQEYSGSAWGNVGKLMHDVDMLDGKHASTAQTADTIPVRDANGTIPGNISGNAATATEASSLASGYTVPVANGGTGATSEAGARASLGADNASNISSGILDIAYGGTGSSQKNFVDLTENQNVGGTKTFSSEIKSTATTLISTVMDGVSIADTTRGQNSQKLMAVVYDKNGKRSAGFAADANTDGSRVIHTHMRNRADTGWIFGYQLKELADGTVQHLVSTPPAAANDTQIATTAWGRSQLVQKSGDTMTGNLKISASDQNQLRLVQGNYGVIFRNDGSNFYLLQTASGSAADGSWNNARPLTVNLSTGVCNINGNAANVTGTVAIANGGTGATTRLAALKALPNEYVGTSAKHFLVITDYWGKGGYCAVADAKTVLGLKSAAYTESSAYAAASHTHSYVAKAGDTMTGILDIKKDNQGVRHWSGTIVKGTNPTATRYVYEAFLDKKGARLGWAGIAQGTDGSINLRLECVKQDATTAASIGIGWTKGKVASAWAPNPPAASNTSEIATTAWVRGRLGGGEFGMVPSNNPGDNDPAPGNNGTTYTAPTNGFLKVEHNNGGNYDCWVYVNGHGTCMHSGGYGSGGQHSGGACFFPVRKGWKFKVTGSNWFAFQRC